MLGARTRSRGGGAPAGQDARVIIPWLHSWPGPAVRTSIRPDVLLATAMPAPGAGTGRGDGAHRDDQLAGHAPLVPDLGLRDFDKAHARAEVMVTVGKTRDGGDSTDGGYFAMNATNLLAAWLHAAALSGGSARDVLQVGVRRAQRRPGPHPRRHPGAADGTAAMLDALYRLPARHHPRVAVDHRADRGRPAARPRRPRHLPARTGRGNRPGRFLRAGGTCYLLADERRAARWPRW